ncbi:MAG: adenylate kinase [Micropruina glycogenica]|jgi:adenylate kinase|uniref:Adenylate kinase n=1 Tax=Micropruina glycogenica TaxID=75385 RepID=A0A2N9JGD6_9ACTN|nr:adenylate kinase [Micropruina glycogenica]MCB0891831.1 adenylate kinase [Propionibacteriaceae bacterium]SPD87160.1 Adenylate kinase [Micropruina glycogenica]
MRLLIMGPPGAGKGTQAAIIGEHYGIPAISTGNIFRLAITNRTKLGERIKRIIADGGYVPDSLSVQVVVDRLKEEDAKGGWLLDGFPRTLGQVQALDEELDAHGFTLKAVVSLTADEDAIVDRMLKRAEIEGRPDDNEETIRHRMEVYHEQTDPLLDVYRTRGLLIEVDGMGTVDEVSQRVLGALAERLGR